MAPLQIYLGHIEARRYWWLGITRIKEGTIEETLPILCNLAAPYRLVEWPYRKALEAKCSFRFFLPCIPRGEGIPHRWGKCGIYALKGLDLYSWQVKNDLPDLYRIVSSYNSVSGYDYVPFKARSPFPLVAGTVALWGRFIEYELGYRAKYAYPLSVRMAFCSMCLRWCSPRKISLYYNPFHNSMVVMICDDCDRRYSPNLARASIPNHYWQLGNIIGWHAKIKDWYDKLMIAYGLEENIVRGS